VGRIVNKIDNLGLGEKTLVVFYSDNGTHRKVISQTNDGPVTGGKGLTTDAGTHVPLLARWTGTIQPAVNDDLVDSTDFIPTLLEVAGRPLSPDSKLDGRSFYPQLLGKAGRPRDWIYCFYDPRPGWDKDQFTRLVFARDKRFKLYDDGRLYDVPNDKLEENPLSREAETAQARAARVRLSKVLKSMEG
jgi:arylsulfatase A-like enzyme